MSAIAGTFNEWDVTSYPMERSQKGENGYVYWHIPMRLQPGTYQYRLFCGWPVVERPCIEPVYAK